jgi:hypothetical protein
MIEGVTIGSGLSYLVTIFIFRSTTLVGFLLRAAISLATSVSLLFISDKLFVFPTNGTLPEGNALVVLITLIFVSVNLLFIVAPILLAAVVAAILTISELLVRRVSEHSKGPIFALSALLAALGAAAKALGLK